MPVEISKEINKNKYFAGIANFLFELVFCLVRVFYKAFAYRNGNLVIIALCRLGDTVFTIPGIKEIQKFYQRKIIIFCYPESVPIYSLKLTDVDFFTIEREHFFLVNAS